MPSKVKVEASTNVVIAVAGVITLVVIIFSLLAGKSLVAKLRSNNNIITQKKRVDSDLSHNLAALTALSNEYNRLGSVKQLVANALPEKADFPALSSSIELMASDAGVKLSSIGTTTTAAVGNSAPSPLDFTVTLAASYDTLKQFLRNFEMSLRPMIINSITINGTSSQLTADLRITTYAQGPVDITPKTADLASAAATTITSQNPSAGKTPELPKETP
jgi:Tfp pilus assembly protein PilO